MAAARDEHPDLYAEYESARARGEAPERMGPEPVAKGVVESAAWARICALADELTAKSNAPLTREAALVRVMELHPDLYAMYDGERRRGR
jgi:hypothetical protein